MTLLAILVPSQPNSFIPKAKTLVSCKYICFLTYSLGLTHKTIFYSRATEQSFLEVLTTTISNSIILRLKCLLTTLSPSSLCTVGLLMYLVIKTPIVDKWSSRLFITTDLGIFSSVLVGLWLVTTQRRRLLLRYLWLHKRHTKPSSSNKWRLKRWEITTGT